MAAGSASSLCDLAICNAYVQQKDVANGVRLDDRMLLAVLPVGDAEIARELGMSRSTIWRVRSGRAKLSSGASENLAHLVAQRSDAHKKAQAIAKLFDLALRDPDVRDALAALGVALLRKGAT